jgi:hypothetical protein
MPAASAAVDFGAAAGLVEVWVAEVSEAAAWVADSEEAVLEAAVLAVVASAAAVSVVVLEAALEADFRAVASVVAGSHEEDSPVLHPVAWVAPALAGAGWVKADSLVLDSVGSVLEASAELEAREVKAVLPERARLASAPAAMERFPVGPN